MRLEVLERIIRKIASIYAFRINKYNIKWPNSGWSKWDQDTYQSYQTNVREQLAQDTTLTEDEKLAFYWELIHWQNLN